MKLMRAVIEFEILYDADINDPTEYDILADVYDDTINGNASGNWKIVSNEEISKDKMRELLIEQGSDPEFLITDNGEED